VPVTMGFHISVEGWIGFGIQRQGRKNTAWWYYNSFCRNVIQKRT
jgi:hypothetical protein